MVWSILGGAVRGGTQLGRAGRVVNMGKGVKSVKNVAGKGGGILSRNAGKIAGGGGLATGYGVSKLFGGAANDEEYQDQGDGATSGGLGGSGSGGGGGGSFMSGAAGATSVLSDADSSDPVVRQLQDIERVLQSIKGDTAQFVSMGGMMARAGGVSGADASRSLGLGRAAAGLPFVPAALMGLGDLFQNNETAAGIGETMFGRGDRVGTEAGTQERFDATIDNELVQYGTKTGARIGKGLGNMADNALQRSIAKGDATLKSNRVSPSGKSVELKNRNGDVEIRSRNPETGKVGGKLSGAAETAAREAMENADNLAKKAARGAGDMAGKIGQSIVKRMPAAVAKIAGDAVGIGGMIAGALFMGEKLLRGDFVGAGGELLGMFPGVGIPADIANLARDVYMDVYEVAPETDPLVNERMPELSAMVLAAATEALGMEDAESPGPVEAQVEARPEVTAKSGHAKRNQMSRQKKWDEKYGEMYNVDGSIKDEYKNELLQEVEVTARPIELGEDGLPVEEPSVLERIGRGIVDPISTFLGDGEDSLISPEMLNDSQMVDDATAVHDAEMASIMQGGFDGLSSALQSGIAGATSNPVPIQPEVSVNVQLPKTSQPPTGAEREFMNRRMGWSLPGR